MSRLKPKQRKKLRKVVLRHQNVLLIGLAAFGAYQAWALRVGVEDKIAKGTKKAKDAASSYLVQAAKDVFGGLVDEAKELALQAALKRLTGGAL